MRIPAGKLNRVVTVRREAPARDAHGEIRKDGYGQIIVEWVDMVTVRAARQSIRDDERIRAAQVSSTVTDRFQIRWSNQVDDLTTRDRLVCDGHEYNIVAVKEIGLRDAIEITAARAG